MDLALNNQQRLICHKTQTNKQTNKLLFVVFFYVLMLPQLQLAAAIHFLCSTQYCLQIFVIDTAMESSTLASCLPPSWHIQSMTSLGCNDL